jgi:hypothetical protein
MFCLARGACRSIWQAMPGSEEVKVTVLALLYLTVLECSLGEREIVYWTALP